MDERIRARRRAVQQAQLRRRRRIAGSVAVLLLLAAGALGLASSPLFGVAEVAVEGASGPQADEARRAAGIVPGANLLRLDTARAVAAVEALPWVRRAEVRRAPPATLVVAVVPRQAVALVEVSGALWQVDADGVLVAGGQRPGLVVVEAPHAVLPRVGEKVHDAAVRNALAVHTVLPADLRRRVDRYEAPSQHGLRLRLDDAAQDGLWVRFGSAERIEAKVRALRLLLDQIADQRARASAEDVDPPGIGTLDVRAPDNPVLVTTDALAPDAQR